ncbi:MAG: hypothetical protein Q8J69_02305 [Sphingobacteriaceae bacterium]|nr:hypothetical protein [Sphingobacteriaceae bacterium]
MKRILLLGLLTGFLFAGCKKKETPKTPEEIYSERLDGNWNLASLTYTASVPVPVFGLVPINGTSANAGRITFNHSAKTANYDIRFLPNIPAIPGIAVDTIRLNGNGTYTNTTTNITLTETSGQVLVFSVVANEATLQLLNTQLNYQLDSVTTVPVSMQMRLSK